MTQVEVRMLREIFGFISGRRAHAGRGFYRFPVNKKNTLSAAKKLEAAGIVIIEESTLSNHMLVAMSPEFAKARGVVVAVEIETAGT